MLNGYVLEHQGKHIVIVDVNEVLENAFGKGYFTRRDASYDEEIKAVQKFCRDASFSFYADEKEQFSIYAAAEKAISERHYGVVVENLS